MKKYFALFIATVILSFTLCIPSFASNKKVITLSDDYKYMYYSGSTYTRVDASMLSFFDFEPNIINSDLENEENAEYIEESIDGIYSYTAPFNYDSFYTIKLTEEQHKEVKTVEVTSSNHDETLFFIIIYFYDGSELHIDFIIEDLVDEYNKLINGNTDEYNIDFLWPDGNIVTVDKDKFIIGKKAQINAWDVRNEYSVYAHSTTGSFNAEIGLILQLEESYYFYSFADSDVKSLNEFWELGNEKIKVIELTDEEIINEIKAGEEKRLEDDFGYLYNDELTETVAKIFFTIVFAVIPAVVFVASLILAIKSKKSLYKKLLFANCGISVAVIITFIYIACTLFNK